MSLNVITTNAGKLAILNAQAQGLQVTISHLASGSSGHTPLPTATALVAERERVAIASSRRSDANYRLDLNAVLDSEEEYWVREVGFFSSTGVLVFLWSAPEAEFTLGYKSAPVRFLLGLSLTIVDVPLDAIVIDDQGQPLELSLAPIEEDLRGTHANTLSARHNFEGSDWREIDWIYSAADFEARAEILRANGQSGFLVGRSYGHFGTEAFHRPFDGSFAGGPNIHDHVNYAASCGAAECSAIINGYYVRTRHLDYTLRTPATGNFLATAELPGPDVPPAVLAAGSVSNQIAEMREWIGAYQRRDHSVRDYRPYFKSTLACLEIWPEILQDSRQFAESGFSFRHEEDNLDLQSAYRVIHERGATGYKGRFENSSFPVGVARQVLYTGEPVWVLWRARIICADVGNVQSWPLHRVLTPLDQPLVRWRESLDPDLVDATRLGRYSINRALADDHFEGKYNAIDLLDQLMAKLPGLNGDVTGLPPLTETHTDGTETITLKVFGTNSSLNAAYYSRRYSMPADDAAGRTDSLRGFNDPTLFVALTTRAEVAPVYGAGSRAFRCSYAIPLEIVLRTPLETWNPYNLPVVADSASVTGAGTQGSPFSATRKEAIWYRTPSALFTPITGDAADTGNVAVYVRDPDNVARSVIASGIRTHIPEVVPGLGRIRCRHLVYPQYHEGGHAQAMIEAVAGDTGQSILTLGTEVMRLTEQAKAMAWRLQILEGGQTAIP